jgi:hypothetical protein
MATVAAQKTFQEASVTPQGPGTKTTPEAQPAREENPTQNLARLHKTCQELTKSIRGKNHTNQVAHPRQSHKASAPVRSVMGTGQTGQAW